MATTVTEGFQQNTAEVGNDNIMTTQRHFLVQYDTGAVGNVLSALGETGIPIYGESHPTVPALKVRSIRSSWVSPQNDRTLVSVIVSYSTAGLPQLGGTTIRNTDPWDHDPLFSYRSETREIELEKDANGTVVANSLGDRFDPPIMIKKSVPSASVTFNATKAKIESRISSALVLVGTTNNAEFAPDSLFTFATGTAIFSGVDVNAQVWTDGDGNETIYYAVSMRFSIEDSTVTVMDRGFRGRLVALGTVAKLYIDDAGSFTHSAYEDNIPNSLPSVPPFLDSDGVATTTASNAAELTFATASSADWSPLALMITDRG